MCEEKILLVSAKFLVRNSGARSGCANFMGAWKKCVLSAGNLHVHKIPRFRGGGGVGVFWVFQGGGGDYIFMGAGISLSLSGYFFDTCVCL